MSQPQHDLPLGHFNLCQVCASSKLELVIDLGHQAPCDSLLKPHQLHEPENTYPLRFLRCTDCGLAQIDHVVDPKVLFFPDYPYRSGITDTLVKNLQGIARRVGETYKLDKKYLAIDLGSNDGTLLQGFKNEGWNVLGVEPTNIAKIANENGIPTIQSFFSEKVAREIVKERGKASVVTAANMFAHIPNLGDLIRGASELLVENGVFLTESHYLLDLIETNQYDSIYHEHLKYYSLRPLITLMDYYDFTLVDAERIPNYGGSIRVICLKGKGHPKSDRLNELLALEERSGIYQSQTYEALAKRILKTKFDLQHLVLKLKAEGKSVVGIGCPGRSSTLLNFTNMDVTLMPYIAEQSTSLKLGLYLPGKHIPIVDEKRLFDEQPDYAVMLSWHYAKPIIEKMRKRGLKSKIILPLPDVQVID